MTRPELTDYSQTVADAAVFIYEHSPEAYEWVHDWIGKAAAEGWLFATRNEEGLLVAVSFLAPVLKEVINEGREPVLEDIDPGADCLWCFYVVTHTELRGLKAPKLLDPMLQAALDRFARVKYLCFNREFRDDMRVRIRKVR